MSLKDAWQLFTEPLSSKTKPTEKEARAAAREVFFDIADLLLKIDDHQELRKILTGDTNTRHLLILGLFLKDVARVIDQQPGATLKIKFTNTTQGSGRTRTAQAKHIAIARRVKELREAGAKAPVSQTAKEFKMASESVSKISAPLLNLKENGEYELDELDGEE
jgi:hypothetical protein